MTSKKKFKIGTRENSHSFNILFRNISILYLFIALVMCNSILQNCGLLHLPFKCSSPLYFTKIKYSVLHWRDINFLVAVDVRIFTQIRIFFLFYFFWVRLKKLNSRRGFFRALYILYILYFCILLHFIMYVFFTLFIINIVCKNLQSNRQFLFYRPRSNLYYL